MPLSPTATRDLLNRLGHSPRRFLGQNFLVDGNIVRKSLELAAVRPGDTVVEIGPGLGTLTSALLEAGATVWAVEKDPTLAGYLRTSLAEQYPDRLHLLEGDAVEHPLAGLVPDQADFKIVANLPYAISSPWMEAVLAGPLPVCMVLMLQLEAAERYAANPGTKNFGAISIFLQSAFEVMPGHRVAAACFHPRPEVDSCLLHLGRRPAPFHYAQPVRSLIRACFQQRRKQLRAVLRQHLPDGGQWWLARLGARGFSAQSRAEQIPVEAWQELTLANPHV